jgi:outer membrane receptor for ferrienterochelin and colicins
MFFANDIEDMIYTDSWRAGYRPSLMTYSNVDKARIRGYELQGRYALNPAIGLRANYTYADGENRDSGETLRNTPRHLANVGIDWQATAKLGANLDYQYTGSQLLYVSAARPSVESDAYHTLNLGARYQATPELALKAGINNLANEKRDDVARSVDNILMGRSLFVGLNYDL